MTLTFPVENQQEKRNKVKNWKIQSHDFEFFYFSKKSAENGQSQIDFGQNLLDFL